MSQNILPVPFDGHLRLCVSDGGGVTAGLAHRPAPPSLPFLRRHFMVQRVAELLPQPPPVGDGDAVPQLDGIRHELGMFVHKGEHQRALSLG